MKNKNKNGTDDKSKITTSTKYPLCSCENWKFEHTKNQPTTYTITLHPMLHHHHGHYTYFPKSTTQCVHCIYSFNEHVVHNKTCLYMCICVCNESTRFKRHHKCNGMQSRVVCGIDQEVVENSIHTHMQCQRCDKMKRTMPNVILCWEVFSKKQQLNVKLCRIVARFKRLQLQEEENYDFQ